MAQVVLMVFEDLSQASDSPNRHIVQVHVSPGVKSREQLLNKSQRGDRRDTLQVGVSVGCWEPIFLFILFVCVCVCVCMIIYYCVG